MHLSYAKKFPTFRIFLLLLAVLVLPVPHMICSSFGKFNPAGHFRMGVCYSVSLSYNKLTFGKGTVLLVSPDITDSDPAVYQLTDSESSNTTLCLATDFTNNVTLQEGLSMMKTNVTVLDMKSTYSKSNGVLAWSENTGKSCEGVFKGTNFYPNEEASCDATIVEQSFETDMQLNYQNLLVIGFRVFFLKMVGFNLLMTLRLWSS